MLAGILFVFWATNPLGSRKNREAPEPQVSREMGTANSQSPAVQAAPQASNLTAAEQSRRFRLEATQRQDDAYRHEQSQAAIEMEGSVASGLASLVAERDRLKSVFGKWSDRLTQLATNVNGRKIVSNTEVLNTVLNLIQQPEISDVQVSNLCDEMLVVEKSAKGITSFSSNLKLPGEMLVSMRLTKDKLIELRKTIEKSDLALTTFEAQSEKLQPANSTLHEALTQRERTEALAWAKTKEDVRRSVFQKSVDEIRAAETKTAELELGLKKATIDAEQKLVEANTAAIKIEADAKAERAVLEAEFNRDLPQIMHYLSPFFAKGYQQISTQGFVQTNSEMPMSLRGITTWGVFTEEYGMPSFLALVNDSTNDRKIVGPYPRYTRGDTISSAMAEMTRPGITFLKKYQHLLVEKKMLAE